jgi:hypothetical protein
LLIVWQKKQAPPAAGSNPSSGMATEAQLGPPVGEEVRILAGAGRSFVDHAGKLWSADTWFDGGTAVKSSVKTSGARRTQVSTAAAGRDNFATGFP